MTTSMAGELNVLSDLLNRVSESDRRVRDTYQTGEAYRTDRVHVIRT